MKALLLTTILATSLAIPALAQDAPASPFQTEAAGPALAASDVIGARIYASEGALDADAYNGVQEGWEDIGEVNDIILGRDGTVDAVLVDIGGFLGMGERQVAVDMAALRVVQDDATDADDWFLVLQADRATLDQAPAWTMERAAAEDAANAADPAATDAAGDQAAATDPAATAPAAGTEGAETADAVTAETGTDTAASDTAATDTAATDTAAGTGMALPEGYAEVDRATLTSETLTGANVRDTSDASIGEVSDLVLSPEGQVTDVILDVGGFLGIGAKTVALPMDQLTIAQSEGGALTIWVGMSKEELEALPEHSM